jgi:ABC-type nickel/cobalt efflux system permease component RcnA
VTRRSRFLFRLALVASGALALLTLPGAPAGAHPLGNFTVNTYSGIVVAPGEVRVGYVLDMAEIPTFQEMPSIDTDGDGTASLEERAAWAARRAGELIRGVTLTVDGRPVPLAVSASSMVLRPGQGGLSTLRLEATFTGSIAASGRIHYRDENFGGLIGWREVTAVGEDGRALTGSTIPARSVSNELRSYPQDLLSSPVDVSEASFSFAPGRSSREAAGPDSPGGDRRPGTAGGAFASLVSRPDLSVAVVLVSLALALGLGALHALGPGHGKTVIAGYLVGASGGIRQAVAVGAAVSAMHTSSVLGLGVAILSVERVLPAERVYPWLGLVAGLVALGLGTGLLIARIHAWSDHRRAKGASHHGHSHAHPHPEAGRRPLSRRGLAALAVSGGLLPSPSALLVLLASVALHRLAFGLALIAAFSVGMAGALSLVAVLATRARDLVSRRMDGRLARLVPVASAGTIAVVGAVLTLRAVIQL